MFWSKIWIFLVALAAAAALTIALALPRSAHKSRVKDERQRLVVACDIVNILLESKAAVDVDVAGRFSRDERVVGAVEKIKLDDAVDATKGPAREVADAATAVLGEIKGDTPAFAIVTDARGRVVARVGVDEGQIGDTLAGRYLVDDALHGYLRDDVWFDTGTLFLVAGSPVVTRKDYSIVGAVVLGWKLDNAKADSLVGAFRDADGDAEDRSIHVAFYADDKQVTRSTTPATLDTDVLAEYGKATKPEAIGDDCKQIAPFYARHDKAEYAAVLSRLPGAAAHDDAFFAVFTPRPAEGSFGGAIGKAKGELGGGFPWVLIGVVFVLMFGGGVALTIFEADRPLRRLQADAVRLAKGETERLAEDDHGGRFGSIARSVNIQVDKLQRDAKAAKKDLDQLLGPAPEGSLGALDLLGGTPLPSRPGIGIPLTPAPAPAAPPPPSAFKFSDDSGPTKKPGTATAAPDLDLGPARPAPGRPAPWLPAAPPPKPPVPGSRNPTPPPRPPVLAATSPGPVAPLGKKGLDDDILTFGDEPSSAGSAPGPGGDDDAYFRSVFDQFVELKRKCGEPTAGLTFAKFGDKLRKNRDDLMAKTGCTQVKFTVYVKDGKAALKATPVKEA